MTGFGPLPVSEDPEDGEVRWSGVSRILGPKWLQLPALTVGLLGVQVLWSVEMSQASPYLIRLGLSKSLTAIAFLAGPLSGLLVQPLIGVIADHSKSRFGRRRPYMLLASVICAGSMLLLGYTREFVSTVTSRGSVINNTLTIVFAVVALYGIDFSVNAVQAVDRALIVDVVPASLQPDGNAWAARMLGIGSVLGFFIGNVDLTEYFSFLGESELKILSVFAASLLLITQSATAACVKEKVLVSSSKGKKGFRQELREIWDNILTLPRVIRQICIIQFLAWFAWFPVLFYTSVYVGDLYKTSLQGVTDPVEAAMQDKEADIIGSRALFHQGLVSLAANFILPLLVKAEGDAGQAPLMSGKSSFLDKLKIVHLSELWAFSHLLFAICMGATFFVSDVAGASFVITLVGFSWAITQWAPFSLLAGEILASSQDDSFDDLDSIRLLETRSDRRSLEPLSADPEVLWDESNERQRLVEDGQDKHAAEPRGSGEVVRVRTSLGSSRASSSDGGAPRTSMGSRGNGLVLGNSAARQSHVDLHSDSDAVNGSTLFLELEREGMGTARKRPGGLQAKSGIIIGIHNLFIVVPQFISTAFTSLIFALFDPAKSVRSGHDPGLGLPGNGTFADTGTDTGMSDVAAADSELIYARDEMSEAAMRGANSVAIVFRIGGIAAALAFVLSWRLARELKTRR